MNLIHKWISAFRKPISTIEAEVRSASWKDAAVSIGIFAAAVTGLIGVSAVLTGNSGSDAAAFLFSTLTLLVLVGVIIGASLLALSAAWFAGAKLVGGKGSFKEQTNALIMVAPFGVLFAALAATAFLFSPRSQAVAVVKGFPIGFYQLYLFHAALRGTHKLSGGKTAAILLAPIFILVAVGVWLILSVI